MGVMGNRGVMNSDPAHPILPINPSFTPYPKNPIFPIRLIASIRPIKNRINGRYWTRTNDPHDVNVVL